ncbi:MAG: sugar kinase, partial [Lentisphaerae bacterium]|nr:sugar kinase [Lentisphaerota bacterium]
MGDGKSIEVVVVGSVALDTVATPFERREALLGGSCTYACAAASFFAATGMVGIVGEDFPEEHVKLYARFGIDTAGLQRVPGETFRWEGEYEDDMINRRTLLTELNVFESFSPELPEAYREAPFLLLGNIAPSLQLHVLDQVRGTRFTMADTMDLWINTTRDALMELIGRVDMVTLNDSEARMLAEEHNLRRCAEKILEWGPSYAVIKKGEHGAMV